MMHQKSAPNRLAPLNVLRVVLALLSLGALLHAHAQSISGLERDRGRLMLNIIKDDVKKNYYDPAFRGVDLDARFKAAEEKLKQATSNGQIFGVIAQVLLELKDSHTFFIPPARASRIEYGWQMQMVGDTCYVTAVMPGSDAEAKGHKEGDVVHTVDGYKPVRENLWTLQYLYYALAPRPGVRVVVQSPAGPPRQLEIAAKVREGKQVTDLTSSVEFNGFVRDLQNEDRLHRQRYSEQGDDLMIWKMPQFDLSEDEVDQLMGKVKKHKALILDLRGNGGGYVLTLQRLAGHFFEKGVKIADLKGRKEMKPMMVKRCNDRLYDGKLVVLVDSRSASAAELFARLVQLEKRGTVIGDLTSGSVMQSVQHQRELGTDTLVIYGTSITNADVIMSDGKSLENVGVTPDELLLPTGEELAAKRDPVLARAASQVGVKLEPVKAGTLFPVEWRK